MLTSGNQIILQLDGEHGSVEPIVYAAPDGNVVVSDWAEGFMDAVGLRSDAWKSLVNDDDVGYQRCVFSFSSAAECRHSDGAARSQNNKASIAAHNIGGNTPKCVPAQPMPRAPIDGAPTAI